MIYRQVTNSASTPSPVRCRRKLDRCHTSRKAPSPNHRHNPVSTQGLASGVLVARPARPHARERARALQNRKRYAYRTAVTEAHQVVRDGVAASFISSYTWTTPRTAFGLHENTPGHRRKIDKYSLEICCVCARRRPIKLGYGRQARANDDVAHNCRCRRIPDYHYRRGDR